MKDSRWTQALETNKAVALTESVRNFRILACKIGFFRIIAAEGRSLMEKHRKNHWLVTTIDNENLLLLNRFHNLLFLITTEPIYNTDAIEAMK